MTSNNDNEVVERNSDYFVREITIKRGMSIDRLLGILRQFRTTGNLCVYLNQGGVRRIELHERTATTGKQSDQIREILDIGDKTS